MCLKALRAITTADIHKDITDILRAVADVNFQWKPHRTDVFPHRTAFAFLPKQSISQLSL